MNTVRIRVARMARYSDLSIVRLDVSSSKVVGCRCTYADAGVKMKGGSICLGY